MDDTIAILNRIAAAEHADPTAASRDKAQIKDDDCSQ
jgi:hypothetical protein